jgi:hypothetical protein
MTIFLFETWRTVPSLPQYEASTLGRVRRKRHRKRMPNGGSRWYGGKAHRGTWNKTDKRYQFFFRGRVHKIAQCVCEAFHGRKPFSKAVAMHIDENSRINRADNLEWGTQKQNLNAPGFLSYASRVCRAKMQGKNVA